MRIGLVASVLAMAVASGGARAQPAPGPAEPKTAVATGAGSTVEAIRKRGKLRCGASAALAGFGQVDAKGQWSGFDVDICRAIATAVLGDATKVEFVPLTAKERFNALRQGVVDIISRDTTWTLSREASNNLVFAGIDFYDGQGFLVRKDLGVKNVSDLPSSSVCVQQDTTTELNLSDYYRQRNLKYAPKTFPTAEGAEAAYRNGACGAFTTDASALFVVRAKLPDPDKHVILPQVISKEPLGPAVRQGDDTWFLIARWTLAIMIGAEEMGINQKNVEEVARGDDPRAKRLLGIDGNFGQGLGLQADWAYRVLKLVGNYNDVFQRNLGDQSRINMKRGSNDLWTRGGLMYAPPVQ